MSYEKAKTGFKNNLCFDPKSFMKADFSVDSFLSEHHKGTNLETLRDDLGLHLKTLRSSMIELINEDYEDFMNLSKNLIGLDTRIQSVQLPLSEMKDTISELKMEIDEEIKIFTDLMARRKSVMARLESVRSITRLQEYLQNLQACLDGIKGSEGNASVIIVKLKWAANIINQYKFYAKSSQAHLNKFHIDFFEKQYSSFMSHLNRIFLSSVRMKESTLTDCLNLYVELDEVHIAQTIIRDEFAAPLIDKIVQYDFLCNEPAGLSGLYDKLLSAIDSELSILLETVCCNDILVEFDFFGQSVWPKIALNIQTNLKTAYSPTSPDEFFQNYIATEIFSKTLSERCICDIYASQHYKQLSRCWNLSVYFTLRFQEIAGVLEIIFQSNKCVALSQSQSWKLLVCDETWNALNRCWHGNVFLKEIAHKFFKLTLQILSRFSTWSLEMINSIHDALDYNKRIEFSIYLHQDTEHLAEKVRNLWETIELKLPKDISPQTRINLQKSLEECVAILTSRVKQVETGIVKSLTEQCLTVVRYVGDIPRLYRRTNRSCPTQPCSYVVALLSPLAEFERKFPSFLESRKNSILATIASKYCEHLSDVLTSVQKTEESLRRFKKIRDPGNEGKSNTDDDKIRLQIQIDIQHFLKTTSELNIPDETTRNLSDILNSLKKN